MKKAFTLIELLVVIAIIAILAAILFPVFAQAKTAAKRSACLSNVKQIGLGMYMYAGDSDDCLPFRREVDNGGDWWTAKMKTWKDATLPYIKNGGRQYRDDGLPYQTKGTGGIYESPLATAAWSTSKTWGFGGTGYPGDESTRFPRSYAVNGNAGNNELGLRSDGQGYNNIWPCVGDGGCGSGNMTSMDKPADTIMIAMTRIAFGDISMEYLGYSCLADGTPWGDQPLSCVNGTGNGGFNMAFFDGHAKNIKAKQTVANDMWGALAVRDANFKQNLLNSMNNIAEWK